MSPLAHLVQILAGLVVTFLLGLTVKPLLTHATKSMSLPPPSSALASEWVRVVSKNEGGSVLGPLERFLFFCAFLVNADVVVAGWLAFKVASKWNVWTNIVSVPKDIPDIDPIGFLIARRSWASHLLVTFLVGTLANVIAGFLGVVVARHGYAVVMSLLR
ncbi:hypothetical protein OH720_19205 [Pseudomonas sp. WJP1]|uniref:hypothetical protein n=1 Tax=Pseudomonas sp. WJP1 TaxID=2986947 RepID=UPI00234AB923|nr:hypothetical protein [Pseudomonas sp. WJP1]WCM49126.1 hypothetical protein OH720_19205 [Pseudomonas sp. WJP1]